MKKSTCVHCSLVALPELRDTIKMQEDQAQKEQGCLSRTEHCENKMKEWLVKPAASSTGVTSEVQTQSWQALVGTGIHCPPTLANATVRDAVQSLQATARKTRTHASPSFLTQSWFLCLGPYMPQPGHPPL